MHRSYIFSIAGVFLAILTATSALPTFEPQRADLVGREPSPDSQASESNQPSVHNPRELIPDLDLYERDAMELDERNYFEFDERSLDIDFNDLEARRGGIGEGIADAINAIVDLVKAKVQQDNENRVKFTQETVAEGRKKFPQFNWVVCHVKHDYKFGGTRGKDWGHSHHEVDIKVGGTIGYEIYWFRDGWFERQGDGSYINWAWSGFPKEVSKNGAHIIFNKPPGSK